MVAFLHKNQEQCCNVGEWRGCSAFIQFKHKLFKEQVYPRGMAVKVEDEVRDHRGLS